MYFIVWNNLGQTSMELFPMKSEAEARISAVLSTSSEMRIERIIKGETKFYKMVQPIKPRCMIEN